MSLVFKCLVSISFVMSLSAISQAESSEGVSVQDVTRHFRDSQQLLVEAHKRKGVEPALRALTKADEAIKKAKSVLRSRQPANSAEVRMKARLMYKLDQDQKFLNQLKSDLGLAEMDSIESYIALRRSLLKDSEQRPFVVKMDQQILLTLEGHSYN